MNPENILKPAQGDSYDFIKRYFANQELERRLQQSLLTASQFHYLFEDTMGIVPILVDSLVEKIREHNPALVGQVFQAIGAKRPLQELHLNFLPAGIRKEIFENAKRLNDLVCNPVRRDAGDPYLVIDPLTHQPFVNPVTNQPQVFRDLKPGISKVEEHIGRIGPCDSATQNEVSDLANNLIQEVVKQNPPPVLAPAARNHAAAQDPALNEHPELSANEMRHFLVEIHTTVIATYSSQFAHLENQILAHMALQAAMMEEIALQFALSNSFETFNAESRNRGISFERSNAVNLRPVPSDPAQNNHFEQEGSFNQQSFAAMHTFCRMTMFATVATVASVTAMAAAQNNLGVSAARQLEQDPGILPPNTNQI